MTSRRTALLLIAATSWAATGRCSLSRPPASDVTPRAAATAQPPAPQPGATAGEPEPPEGVFHRIEPGQTLWRIARAYGVSIDALLSANGLTDPGALASGTMLFVPGATALLHVPPYPAPAPVPAPPAERQPVAEHPADGGFVWPVTGGEVLSCFGAPRHGRRHAGIDIRGPKGQDILATQAGEVAYAGSRFSGYGKMVILDHGNGLQSVYAHASALLVATGDHVERGQAVARVGRTGNATTEHCHFELRENDVPIDPLPRYPEVERLVAAAAPRTTTASKSGGGHAQKRNANPTYP